MLERKLDSMNTIVKLKLIFMSINAGLSPMYAAQHAATQLVSLHHLFSHTTLIN